MTRLRVGVIGLGVGEEHARAYAAHPGCEVVALCDLSRERLARVARDLPGPRTTTDAGDVLDAADIDLVSIASYDDAHFEQTLRALRAAKHVFVEKPLCRSQRELVELKAAWRERPALRLASNLVLRAAPLFEWARARREAGEFGPIFAFDGDYLYGRIERITEGWRKDVADYSVIQGGAVHLVDLMLCLTGEKPTAVSAAGNRISTAASDFRYSDYVSATFHFPSGLVGRITANFGCVHRHQHVVRMFGTKATLVSDDAGARLHTSRDPSMPAIVLEQPALPVSKGALVGRFVDSILAGADGAADAQHEFDLTSACVAADRAAASGRLVDIEYV